MAQFTVTSASPLTVQIVFEEIDLAALAAEVAEKNAGGLGPAVTIASYLRDTVFGQIALLVQTYKDKIGASLMRDVNSLSLDGQRAVLTRVRELVEAEKNPVP
jgi:hypothetical protein